MSEDKFWKLTPRKFFSLVEEHNKANSVEDSSKPNPDKLEKFTLEDFKEMGVGNLNIT